MIAQQKCVDGPSTSKAADLDCDSEEDDDNIFDFDVLQCPMCSRQLMAMELDIIDVDGEKFQRIWWTCSGIKTMTCDFPTALPENVFFTQRSMKQMRNGFFPLPNLHLLPSEYWHLYPKLFDAEKGPLEVPLTGRKVQKLAHSVTSREKCIKKPHRGSPRDGKEDECNSIKRRFSVSSNSTEVFSQTSSEIGDLESSRYSFPGGADGGPPERLNISGTVVPFEDIGNIGAPRSSISDDTILETRSCSNLSRIIEDETDVMQAGTSEVCEVFEHPTVSCSSEPRRKVSADAVLRTDYSSTSTETVLNDCIRGLADLRDQKALNAALLLQLENAKAGVSQESDDIEVIPDDSSDVMDRITKKQKNLVSAKKAIFEARANALKKQVKKHGYTLDPSVVPYEDLSKQRSDPSEHFPLVDEGIPAEELFEEKEELPNCEECFTFLKQPKEEPQESGMPRRGVSLEGESTPFMPEDFPTCIIDPRNWYRPVHLMGKTSLDGFVSWYNLRFNKKPYLEALASEMCKRGVMKFVPSIPIKQQRMVRQLHEEVFGRKTIDIEKLKKGFDSNALRLQMAHRLGLQSVEPVIEKRGRISKESGKGMKHGAMQAIGSVPLGDAPLHAVRNLSSLADHKERSSFSFVPRNFVAAEEDADPNPNVSSRKSISVPDFGKWSLSEKMISEFVMTGNHEVDEFLQQKVAKQIKQAIVGKKLPRQENVLKRPIVCEPPVTEEAMGPKRRRFSEMSQQKEEANHDNLESLFDECYDEDEEFCTQIYGSQNL